MNWSATVHHGGLKSESQPASTPTRSYDNINKKCKEPLAFSWPNPLFTQHLNWLLGSSLSGIKGLKLFEVPLKLIKLVCPHCEASVYRIRRRVCIRCCPQYFSTSYFITSRNENLREKQSPKNCSANGKMIALVEVLRMQDLRQNPP